MDHTEILAPDDAPSWVQDRGRLWNEVEAAETRKNSQVAREIVVALPKELEAGAQRHLVRGFVSELCVRRGMVADVAYHDIASGNPHAHVLLTTRRVDPDGFAGKDRLWKDRGLVQDWRREWAEHANRALARARIEDRIDHRSLASQRQDALHRGDRAAAAALDRPAGVHLGRALHQEVRTGRTAERVSRALERNPEQPRQEREGPELRPSGLERISRFDRELRQAIERAAAALRECVRELRHEIERVAGWTGDAGAAARGGSQAPACGGSSAAAGKKVVAEAGARSRRPIVRLRPLMASTEDRMRENRRVLAEITKSERTVTRLLHGMPEAAHELRIKIDALADTARQMHAALNRAWWVLLTISFVGGAGGAVTVLLLSEWIGSFFR